MTPTDNTKTFQELCPTLEGASDVRSLLTDAVKAAYREEPSESERAMIEAELRQIARAGRFTKDFDKAFSSFRKEIVREEKALLAQERKEQREAWAAENKIDLAALGNPYPALRSYVYSITPEGIFLGSERICTQPILVFGKMKNVETDEEAICIAYFSSGIWQERVIKREILFNASKVIRLAAHGLNVHSANARDFIRFLDVFMEDNRLALLPKLSASRLGWLPGGRFFPYDRSIVFDGDTENRVLFNAVRSAGCAEKWISYVRELRKNTELRLTMAAGFASPLIELAGALPFVLNLWGGSGTHKTVALMVTMSVWGNPTVGELVNTVNATRNYMMNSAAFFFSLPVAYDELQIAKLAFSNIEALVMFLTEGVNRGRMKYDESQGTKIWRCSFLFTGEEPILKPTSDGGVYNHVIEVETKGPLTWNGNEVANFVKTNYGHAGKIFIEYIKEHRDNIQGLFREYNADILRETGATDKQAASAALMLLGDKLAGECLFPGEHPLTVADIKPYLKTQATVDVAERAYEYICGQIAVNSPKFLNKNTGDRHSTGEVWGRVSNGVCTINKGKLDDLMDRGGFNFDAVKKLWADKGHLLRTTKGRLIDNASILGVKSYCARIVMDMEEYQQAEDQEDDLPL